MAAGQPLVPNTDGQYSSDVQHHREMPMRIIALGFRLLVPVLASCALAGCHATQPPVIREDLVGSYTYVSEDPASRATDYSLSRLVLRSDGTYDLIEGGTTKAVSEKKGVWRTAPGTPPDHVDVVLDHSGYPVEMRKEELRLLVDLDTGVWWVKPR